MAIFSTFLGAVDALLIRYSAFVNFSLGAITSYWVLAFILIHEGYFFLDHTHRHTPVGRTPLDE